MENFYFDTTIDELYKEGHISIRAYHELENNGIFTLGDVNSRIIKNNRNLPIVKGMGRITSSLLLDILANVDWKNQISPDKHCYMSLSDKEREIVEKSFVKIINDNKFGQIVQRLYKSSCEIFVKLFTSSSSLIDYIDDLSYNEYKQLRTACLQYCKVIISCLLEDGLDNCITYKVFSRNYALLYSTPISVPYDKMINGISEKLSFFLQRKYEEVCLNTMSSRALNFQKQYLPNFKDAILFFDKDEIISSIKPDATMIATNKEIVTMLHEYKDIFLKHINDDDDSLIDLNIMDEYPFLCKDERVFILEFTNEFGYKPLFFILYKYLTTSHGTFETIFCRRYGLYEGREEYPGEICKDYNLSEARIRQILSDCSIVNKCDILHDKDWEMYDIPTTYIIESSSFFLDITVKEKIKISIKSFGALLSLKFNVKIDKANGNDIILINDTLKNVNLNIYFDSINNIINSIYYDNKCIPLTNFIIEKCGIIDNSIIALTKEIFANCNSISFDNNIMIIKKNKIDIASELERILLQANEPLRLDILFSRLKETFPEIKYEYPSQIKIYIQKSQNIEPIGKQCIYGLREWKQINFNCIRGTIENLLLESEKPMPIDELLCKVKEYFPNTNIRSVFTSLENEETGRFVRFENNYFGLSCKSYDSSFILYDKIRIFTVNERISQLEAFCELNERFPILFYSNDTETSLSRWLSRVKAGLIKINNMQKIKLNKTIRKYEELNYPQSKTEIIFKDNCIRYMNYVNDNKKLPPSSHQLQLWMYRTKKALHTFNDTRKLDFENLLKFISDKGL